MQKTLLIDHPDKIACVVFAQWCNFRCGYCHNPFLITKKEPIYTVTALFDFLKTRTCKLEGVVITGGEPTLQSGLVRFIQEIKSLGFCVKLDTNGTNPLLLKRLFDDELLDYVTMDIKAPFEKYEKIINARYDISKIRQSIDLIMKSGVEHEFRTTVLKKSIIDGGF